MDSLHIEISGRVQGVGFRWFVLEKARELRLAGWVKNRRDGNVEIAAAGDAEALKTFEAAVRRGPSGARVENARALQSIAAESLERPFGIVR